MHAYRTHVCAELRPGNVGETVRLSGWVHRKRDHGHLLFVDLRDHHGITQIVTDTDSVAFKTLDRIRVESVVTIDGEVVARSKETVNPNLPTGEIEVRATGVAVQSAAAELPMPVFGEQDYPEEIRLTYRYLDLRREQVHANIMLRSAVIASIRRRMIEQGFTEFQTPILTASSPEGARDYLVPSRVHPGKFYALPQAPQMFKQLISVVGGYFRGSGFGLFAKIVEGGGVVRAVPAPNTAGLSRKFFDDMNEWARSEGFAGLGYATRKGGEWGGPIAKNHGPENMD